MRHVSELLVAGIGRPVLLYRGKMPRARGMAAYVRDGYGEFRQLKFESGCCEMLVFRVCGVRNAPCWHESNVYIVSHKHLLHPFVYPYLIYTPVMSIKIAFFQ